MRGVYQKPLQSTIALSALHNWAKAYLRSMIGGGTLVVGIKNE